MRLTPLWTTITAHPVGAREVLLLQNADTGQAQLATLDEDGTMRTVVDGDYVGIGWSDIVSSNRCLLFYDSQTGRGAINEITSDRDLDKYFRAGDGKVIELSRGWTNLVSDGQGILFYNYSTRTVATGTMVVEQPPNGLPEFKFREDHLIDISPYPQFSLFARCRNQLVMYRYSDRGGVYFSAYLDFSRELRWTHGNPSGPDFLAPYTHAVGIQDRLLFYNALGGSAELGRLTQDGEYIQIKTLKFSPWWSHIVSTEYHILFYRSSSGEAVTGYFDAAGDFVQLQTYF